MLLIPFRITRNGIPIENAFVRNPVRTGIHYEPTIPGCVPLFEEREAAVYCNYTPSEFRQLDVRERAACVAQFRAHHYVSQHSQDAVNAEINRRRPKT